MTELPQQTDDDWLDQLREDREEALARLFDHYHSSLQRMLELRERLQRAIGQLSPRDREIILMRHFEFMSNGEVAQALGLSDSAATMRYGRAVFRLKETLLTASDTEVRSNGRA